MVSNTQYILEVLSSFFRAKRLKPYKTNTQLQIATILCTFKIPSILSFSDPCHLTNPVHRCCSTIGNIFSGV